MDIKDFFSGMFSNKPKNVLQTPYGNFNLTKGKDIKRVQKMVIAAPGYEGGWRDRRAEGAPYHQRAYRSRTGLRYGQEEQRYEDRRV